MSLAKIGNTKGGPGLGKYYEGLGYVEMPLRNGEIQQELARWIWSSEGNSSVTVQEKKYKDYDIEILVNEQKFFGKEWHKDKTVIIETSITQWTHFMMLILGKEQMV